MKQPRTTHDHCRVFLANCAHAPEPTQALVDDPHLWQLLALLREAQTAEQAATGAVLDAQRVLAKYMASIA